MIRIPLYFSLTILGVATSGFCQDLRLTVDQATGLMSVENVAAESLPFKGYTVGSAGEHLSVDGWVSLADAGLGGWTEANPTSAYLSELNLDAESSVAAGDSLPLGSAYVTGPHAGDIFFEYVTPDLEVIQSTVHYTGPTNDLAIYVNPVTGEASMANLSPFIDTPSIKGYSILSASGGLNQETWTSFANTGGGGAGWTEANPSASHVSELNLESLTAFENPTSISLGSIIAPGSGTSDLVFEYITAEGEVRLGTVQYTSLPGGGEVPGDCNGDGVANQEDLACASTTEERDIVLATIPSLPGDLDGNGQVDFGDFLVVSNNFGQDLPGYQDGNIDLAGGVEFGDFLVLSSNFGSVPAAAVPEPSTTCLLLPLVVWGCCRRCRRRRRAT